MTAGGGPEMILDRAGGCLVGVAVGDALGGPVEGYSAKEVARRFERLTEMTGGGNKNLAAGETSDDTAHTSIVAESIAARRQLDPADLACRLVDWYRYDGFGIGRHTDSVLARIADGEDWEQASLEIQAAHPGSAGNGSLMRCAPVALLRYANAEVLVEDSRLSSRVTHPHAECQWSCAFTNLVIARLLSGKMPQAAVEETVTFCSERSDFPAPVLERAEGAGSLSSEKILNPSGYVLDSLECALWALLHHHSFEETLVAAVNLGGDADTIGSVSGALAGAAYGIHEIPARWLVYITNRTHLQNLSHEIVTLF